MVVDPLLDPDRSHQSLGVIALIGSLTALVSCFCMAKQPGTAFWNMVRVNRSACSFTSSHLHRNHHILSSFEYLRVQRIRAGEYYGLILLGTVGMCLMSSAIELVLIFIALEISSNLNLHSHRLRRHDAASSESSLKYFLLARSPLRSFSTAWRLFWSHRFHQHRQHQPGSALRPGAVAGSCLCCHRVLVYRLGLQVAAVPFHVWTPDVMKRTLSHCWTDVDRSKSGGVRGSVRIMFEANLPDASGCLGVSGAHHDPGKSVRPRANNIKRLLAYSSIAHAGYLLVAFTHDRVGDLRGDVLLRCLCSDECGAFAVVSHLAGAREKYVPLRIMRVLAENPLFGRDSDVFLMSLIGFDYGGSLRSSTC